MSNEVIVHKGRVNVVIVELGIDVSGDTITSEIRTAPTTDAELLATWDVTFVTDGTDGKLSLFLDDVDTATLKPTSGYMDLKRMSGGQPIACFDRPLEVVLRDSVTL